MGQKSQYGGLFFQKRPLFMKYIALMPILCQKLSFLSKTLCSHVIFSNILWKLPCCHAHISCKKRQFCQKYTIWWANNVNRMSFYLFFTKNHSYHTHILSWKRQFSNKHFAPMPIFWNNVHLSKSQCSHVILFQVFHDKPHIFMPIFGQKNINSQSTLYYGPKKSTGCTLFQYSTKKSLLS